jgi:DNA-binding beta-propeller fold protein YncE
MSAAGHAILLQEWEEAEISKCMEMDNAYLVDVMETVLGTYPDDQVLEILGVTDTKKTLDDVEFGRMALNGPKAARVLDRLHLILQGGSPTVLESQVMGLSNADGFHSAFLEPHTPLEFVPPTDPLQYVDTVKEPRSPVPDTPPILRSPTISKPEVPRHVFADLPHSRPRSYLHIPHLQDVTPHSAPVSHPSVRRTYLFDDNATVRNETIQGKRWSVPQTLSRDPTLHSEFRQEYGGVRTSGVGVTPPMRTSLPPQRTSMPPQRSSVPPPKRLEEPEEWKCGPFRVKVLIMVAMAAVLIGVGIFLAVFFTRPRTATPRAQVVLFAGSGNGFGVDGDRSTGSFGRSLHSLAVDESQSVWVTDGELRVVRPNGTLSTYFNSTTFDPTGVAVHDRQVYIADPITRFIYRVNTTRRNDPGVVLITANQTEATQFNLTFFGFDRVEGLTVHDNELYFCDGGAHAIFKMHLRTGLFGIVAGQRRSEGSQSGTARSAQFRNPTSVAFLNNTMYIADRGNNKIRKMEDGVVSDVVDMDQPFGLAVFRDTLYVTGRSSLQKLVQGRLESVVALDAPRGIAIQDNGLLVLESGPRRIVRIDNL